MPRHKFQATDEQRQRVKSLAGYGLRHKQIALILGLSSTTLLRKHFRQELLTGPAKAQANVRKRLFDTARSGRHPAATIFWLKTRARWSEKGNRPEPTARYETPTWVITEDQPPAPPKHEKAFEEAARRLRAVSDEGWPEWEGDKGGEQEEES
jgi:hypothetical protein